MSNVRAHAGSSVVVLVDAQVSLVPVVDDSDRVVARAQFLLEIARLLGVPVLVTEQNPSRMGEIDGRLLASIGPDVQRIAKMSFSCCGSPVFTRALEAAKRRQVVLLGLETHICVSQTAHDLLRDGYEVLVCPDGVGARSLDRHKLGKERMRDAGVVPAHTEAIAYEWLETAENPKFREALAIVKRFA